MVIKSACFFLQYTLGRKAGPVGWRANKMIMPVVSLILSALLSAQALAAPPQKTVPDLTTQLLENPETIPRLLQQGKMATGQIPNPHWQSEACTACHRTKSGASRANLRQKDINKICNTCHETLSAHDYIHVSNIKVPGDMHKRMPRAFRDSLARGGNKMTCITCHDVPMTCRKNRHKEKLTNPKFFRGGPYKSRTALCYHCHDGKKYKRVNAHDQITDKGVLIEEKCLLCHKNGGNPPEAKSIDEVDFNLDDNLSGLCWGCHIWKPHPGGSFSFFSGEAGTPNHLVKPSQRILERLREKQQENDVVFPLEPKTGRIFCGTCHNPHERGVIRVKQAAKGADSKYRLRVQEICSYCHDK